MSLFMESKWSDSEVETIIKLIQAHPVLWNSNCNEYKDINARNAAFNTIANKLNMPADEVRKKYRNLRTQYVREVRLIKNRGYGTKWNFYGALKFLSTGQASRQNESWDALTSEDTQDYIEQMPSSTNAEAPSTEETELGQYSEDYLEDCESLSDDGAYNIDAHTQPQSFTKRKRHESERNECNIDSKKKRRPTLLIMKQPENKRDEHDVLGEQVANELRALQDQPALQQSLKCSILQSILEVNKALYN